MTRAIRLPREIRNRFRIEVGVLKKRIPSALALIAVATGLYFVSRHHAVPDGMYSAAIEHPLAPDFSLPDLTGQKLDLSSYRGKVVLLDFWATWCGPCRRQIPELVALYKKYNKSRGLVIIGVSCDLIQGDGVKAVAPFVEEFRINYPIALADERLVDSMGVEAIPTTLFVGPDGKLVSRIVGAGHAGEISTSTRQLLDGIKGPASPSKPDDINGHVVDISVTN